MAYDGAGTYTPPIPPVFPAVPGTTILASQFNSVVLDIVAALSTAVCKDGQTTITANLPMAGFRHTNVGAALQKTQYARVAEVQDGKYNTLTSVTGVDTITASATIQLLAFVFGQFFIFKPAGANTGNVTMSVDGLSAVSVKDQSGNELAPGLLTEDTVAVIWFNGTEFILINPDLTNAIAAAVANAVMRTSATGSAQLPTGTTAQRDAEPVAGSLRYNSQLDALEYVDNAETHIQLIPPSAALAAHVAEVDPHPQYRRKLRPAVVILSGAYIDVTDIPSWVTEIVGSIFNMSLNGNDTYVMQLGTSGGIQAAGYNGTISAIGSGASSITLTTAFGLAHYPAFTNADQLFGNFTLRKINTGWTFSSMLGRGSPAGAGGALGFGGINLGADLTSLRFTSNSGTPTFDSGSVQLEYHG